MAQQVNNLPAMQETQEILVQSLDWEDPLEEEIATHSSELGKMPWQEEEEPVRLQAYSPQGHKESDMTERLTLSDPH